MHAAVGACGLGSRGVVLAAAAVLDQGAGFVVERRDQADQVRDQKRRESEGEEERALINLITNLIKGLGSHTHTHTDTHTHMHTHAHTHTHSAGGTRAQNMAPTDTHLHQ